MKLLSIASLLVLPVVTTVSCSREPAGKTGGTAAAPAPARTYPLRGVIVEVQPKESALLVKHEDIRGFMPPMTMLFKVDAATLKAAKPEQAITATLVQTADGFALENVKPAVPPSKP